MKEKEDEIKHKEDKGGERKESKAKVEKEGINNKTENHRAGVCRESSSPLSSHMSLTILK